MLKYLALCGLCLGFLGGRSDLQAQGAIVVEQADHPVEPAGSALPLVEPYVAVNPADAAHLVVGTIVAPTAEGTPWYCAAFASRDGGTTWHRHDFDMERCIDPWILFVPGGPVLFTGIELQDGHTAAQRFHLVAYRSADGGYTWSAEPTPLGRTHDHAMLAATPEPGGPLYLTSQTTRRTPEGQARRQVYVARSDDGGRTFRALEHVEAPNWELMPTGIVLLPDGTLFVSYKDRRPDDATQRDSLGMTRVWGMRSENGGRTFSPPVLVTEGCGIGQAGFPGYPFLAADTSDGPYQGRLYHACIRPGLEGVAVTHSADGGATWSALVRGDTAPVHGPAHARTPMLAVSPEGVVGVAWYDRRHDPERMCQDFYFTASTDGGATFLAPQRISTETSCPGAPGNGRAGTSWPMGGDYSSIAAAPDGAFHLVWADSRSGRFQLHHAVARVEGRVGATR